MPRQYHMLQIFFSQTNPARIDFTLASSAHVHAAIPKGLCIASGQLGLDQALGPLRAGLSGPHTAWEQNASPRMSPLTLGLASHAPAYRIRIDPLPPPFAAHRSELAETPDRSGTIRSAVEKTSMYAPDAAFRD